MNKRVDASEKHNDCLNKLLLIEKKLRRIYQATGFAVFLSTVLIIADGAYLLRYGFRIPGNKTIAQKEGKLPYSTLHSLSRK